MTTATSVTRCRHDSDATFREWGSEFSAKLAAIGLVQTSDTGQINWTTVTRPAANTIAGYEIWRFDDTQQSTSPIYIKFEYGTGGTTTGPRINVTVGSGSNGSGTITATGSFTQEIWVNSAQDSVLDSLRNSYWCFVDGCLSIWWKASSTMRAVLVIGRTVDSSGAPDADGALVWVQRSDAGVIATACMNFVGTDTCTTHLTTALAAQLCHWPHSPSSSLVSTDQQVACAYGRFPRFRPIPWLVGVLDVEFPAGNTFSVAMVGSTPRTYIACDGGTTMRRCDANTLLNPAIIWE